MKNICILSILLGSLLLSGCGQFSKMFTSRNPSDTPSDWDPGYKRSRRVGTGIDPEAREIERRLGYTAEEF